MASPLIELPPAAPLCRVQQVSRLFLGAEHAAKQLMGSPLIELSPAAPLGAASDHERPAKVRRLTQRASNHEDTNPSNSEANLDVPAIFLSHSGQQKAFVEHLNDALMSANHFTFFDQHTLPKGSPFPDRIKQAALGCKLGVVVLSDDFLTSKWPMLELEMLVLQRGPDASVLPLFYKLRPKDLKSPENLSRWRRVWKKKASGPHADHQERAVNAEQWERAVKALCSFNGEVFVEGTSEAAYIKKVVQRICSRVPSPAPYDVSSVQGHQRLAKEIAGQFETACMVGVHGVGGLGKTTLCKIMVNSYHSQYLGRSVLIDFPTHGGDDNEKIILQGCKKALKALTNLSDEHLFSKADSFDQVVQLMKEHVRLYDVFLAIDNVWESSLEAAKRILGVGFSANSKVLLTSRSEQLLQDLLRAHSNTRVGLLPALEYEEAFQILQRAFELGDLDSLVDRNQIDRALKRCRFSENYHALALRALGLFLKRVCMLEGLEQIEHHFSRILKEISNADLQNFEDVIRLSFQNLPEHKKHMFLDIAVNLPLRAEFKFDAVSYAKAHQWLSFLYKKLPKSKITCLIQELALDGLIQIEVVEGREKFIRLHDLFYDLAKQEAASSPRFFTGKSTESVEDIEWERLERVMLKGHDEDSHFIEKLLQQKCPKLQVLYAINGKFRSKIFLDLMPSLCVLILRGGTFVSIENWSAAAGLAIVELIHPDCVQPLELVSVQPILSMPSVDKLQLGLVDPILKNSSRGVGEVTLTAEGVDASRLLSLNGLVQLQRLRVQTLKGRIAGLNTLKNLQWLHVYDCPCQPNLDGLSSLIQLKELEVGICETLKEIPDLSGLTCLERLMLSSNTSMEEVGCLSSAIKHVHVTLCGALKKMPDLSGLTRLEELKLALNASMEEVGGECLSSTLKKLNIYDCRSFIRSFPSLDDCIHMHTLKASARHIKIGSMLEKLPNLQTLAFNMEGEQWCEDHELWKRLNRLQDLSIEGCGSIKIDVGGLTTLTRLRVEGCEVLKEIQDLNALHSLQQLEVCHCPRLKKLSGFMGISSHLNYLQLYNCGSLEASTIPDLSILSSVKCIFIRDCGDLKDFALRHFGWLWILKLRSHRSIKFRRFRVFHVK